MAQTPNQPAGTPANQSVLFRLVEGKLRDKQPGTTLDGFIGERREENKPVPFRKIALELSEITGEDVTHEAVRRWYRHAHPDPNAETKLPCPTCGQPAARSASGRLSRHGSGTRGQWCQASGRLLGEVDQVVPDAA